MKIALRAVELFCFERSGERTYYGPNTNILRVRERVVTSQDFAPPEHSVIAKATVGVVQQTQLGTKILASQTVRLRGSLHPRPGPAIGRTYERGSAAVDFRDKACLRRACLSEARSAVCERRRVRICENNPRGETEPCQLAVFSGKLPSMEAEIATFEKERSGETN
jgi:hypothetical protein